MHHIQTFELLARDRIADRLREAERDAQLRLARGTTPSRPPRGTAGPVRRLGRAVAALVTGERHAVTEEACTVAPGCVG